MIGFILKDDVERSRLCSRHFDTRVAFWTSRTRFQWGEALNAGDFGNRHAEAGFTNVFIHPESEVIAVHRQRRCGVRHLNLDALHWFVGHITYSVAQHQ